MFEPLDFIARLAALVPKPRAHLTRYHGVFAPHSRWRAEVTPAGRGNRVPLALDARTPAERHRALTWAQRLKRVFGIEIATCAQCGGKVKVIASIEDPAVIAKILGHVAARLAAGRDAVCAAPIRWFRRDLRGGDGQVAGAGLIPGRGRRQRGLADSRKDGLNELSSTTLTIAHRLSTIMDSGEILVMLEGRIAERGTHQQLIAKGGWYGRMFEIQKDEVDATLVSD